MSKTKIIALTALISVFFLISFTQAQTVTVKYKVTHYITKTESIEVGDVDGHRIGMYERRGLAIFENGEVGSYWVRGTFDVTKGQGTAQGYSQLTYEDGSTTVAKYQATLTIVKGERLGKSKGEYIKGTGRFKGIQGQYIFTGKFITPYSKETRGDMYAEVTATYTLPSQ